MADSKLYTVAGSFPTATVNINNSIWYVPIFAFRQNVLYIGAVNNSNKI